jgi:hypothetical protein
MLMMMMLLQLHVVNDDDIDDEKNFRRFIDVPVSVPVLMMMLPSPSLDDVVLIHVSRIPFLLRGSVEIL